MNKGGISCLILLSKLECAETHSCSWLDSAHHWRCEKALVCGSVSMCKWKGLPAALYRIQVKEAAVE